MALTDDDVLAIFRETGALLEGHFILRSGLRSGHFFQCARVCERLDKVSELAAGLLAKLDGLAFDTVVAPAMGALVIGQEVARQAGVRFLFVEKNKEDALEMRRGFKLDAGERVLVVEDVVTRGGRAQEALDIVEKHGGQSVGLAILVDRSQGNASFSVPMTSLLTMSFPTYQPDNLPAELQGIPAVKPGS